MSRRPTYPDSAEVPPARRIRLCGVLLVLLVGFGGACRVRQYLARASFMNDEACVVLNARDQADVRLLGPLKFDQVCPPGFLWAERAIGRRWGFGELPMRALPLACSLAALVLFARLAGRSYTLPVALFAVGCFACCPTFTDYAGQVKQYSGDALVAVMLLSIAYGGRRPDEHETADRRAERERLRPPLLRSDAARIVALSMVAAVTVWFSHPTVFLFAAAWCVLAWRCMREGRRASSLAILGGMLFTASFATLYLLSIRHERDPYVYVFWAKGFPPLSRPAHLPGWLVGQLFELCRQPFRPVGAVLAILVVAGVIGLCGRRRAGRAMLLVGPVGLTIAAACAGAYPFSPPSRLTLFLLPGWLLVAAEGVECLRMCGPCWLRCAWWALPIAIVACGISQAVRLLRHPLFHSHVRPVVAYVRAHRQAGDVLYFTGEPTTWVNSEGNDGRRHVEYLCYWPEAAAAATRTLPALADLPAGRFWIAFPFDPKRGDGFMAPVLKQIRAIATQRDGYVTPQGGACYLFERGPAR